MGVEQQPGHWPSRDPCHGGMVKKARCLLRRGLGSPWFPFRADWGRGCSGRGAMACLSLPTSTPPTPLLSSRQAETGLLLHDCPLHRVLRPSCLQQSLKFLQPNLSSPVHSPCSECSAVYLLLLLLLRYCHHQHHYRASRGLLVPKDKDGPILMVQPHIPQTLPLWY